MEKKAYLCGPKVDNINPKTNNNASMELNKTFIDGLWTK